MSVCPSKNIETAEITVIRSEKGTITMFDLFLKGMELILLHNIIMISVIDTVIFMNIDIHC